MSAFQAEVLRVRSSSPALGTSFQTLEEIEVKVSKLSTLLRQFEISHVDFLHIDAQGEDLNVVKGLDEFIFCVKKIELECVSENSPSLYLNQPSCLEVIDYMEIYQFEEKMRFYHSILPREFDVVFEKKIKVI